MNRETTHKNIMALKDGSEIEIVGVMGSKYVKNLKQFAVFVYEAAQKVKEGSDVQ